MSKDDDFVPIGDFSYRDRERIPVLNEQNEKLRKLMEKLDETHSHKWEDIVKPQMPDSTKILFLLLGIVNIVTLLIVLSM